MELKEGDFKALVEARCAEPHAFLGMHAIPKAKASQEALEKQMVVRALLPRAVDCSVVCLSRTGEGKEYPLGRIEESDLFEGILEDESDFFPPPPYDEKYSYVKLSKRTWNHQK